MLKIVYPVCSGIDVHKTFVVATIASTDRKNITTYQTKRFSTFTRDLRSLAQWLSDNQCVDVCMESTGKYWIPVYNILEPSCRINLAHPKYVKAIRDKKTDKKDSIWIADLHKHGLVPGSFIPPADIREIRDLLRYRSKLVSFASSEKNRVQNSLTVSNIMLSSVVSNTFGKSASAILQHLLKHPGDQDFDFRPLLHGSMLKKQDEIALAIDGAINEIQAGKITLCLRSDRSNRPAFGCPLLRRPTDYRVNSWYQLAGGARHSLGNRRRYVYVSFGQASLLLGGTRSIQ
jgi:hypothetical protein